MGVILADTENSAKSIIEAFSAANVNIMVQEFIREAGGSDIRAFVVGREIVAAMKRTGNKGDFRSNLHRGGRAEAVDLTPEEAETALKSCEILGLNVAGVDLLRSTRGPVVMEVNSSPGLEGIERATDKDIAERIVMFLEESARHGETETKGAG
jgi:ribosomal protein S6--L-glutamate ligase